MENKPSWYFGLSDLTQDQQRMALQMFRDYCSDSLKAVNDKGIPVDCPVGGKCTFNLDEPDRRPECPLSASMKMFLIVTVIMGRVRGGSFNEATQKLRN